MNEEVAKTKWCPMVRNDWHGSATNRGYKGDTEYCTCIASDCMMWRWIEIGVTEVSKVNEKHPEWTGQQCYDSISRKGYCGLGGKL
jgi:hypothetical protein